MPKYKPVAELIAEQIFAAKNRLFDLVQKKIDEGKDEKAIMKELKEGYTADPAVLSEIEQTFFKKKAEIKYKVIDNEISRKRFPDEIGKEFDKPIGYGVFVDTGDWSDLSNEEQNIALQNLVEMTGYDEAYTFDKERLQEWAGKYRFNMLTLKPFIAKKAVKVNPYKPKKASWIDDAKIGDQVELNGELGKVTYTGNDKIEVQTPTKTETVWKN